MKRRNRRGVLCAALLSLCLTQMAQGSTLFERIGGPEKLHAVVDQFVKIIIDDDRINFSFANTDLSKFNKLLYAQLCELTKGPCDYTGRDMATAHAKLNINDAQFNALAEDLYKAFDREHVPYRVQNQVIALLAPMQRDIVKPHGFVAPGTQPPPANIR